jgi:hypothetical protein
MSADGDLAGDDVIDAGIVALVRDFARLSDACVEQPDPHLLVVRLSPGDEQFFGGKSVHRLALSVSAVQRYPDSELPVVGGTFWSGLLRAIRQRGSRTAAGTAPATVSEPADVPDVVVRDASIALVDQRRDVRRLVRLLVKVTLAAGTTVEEELVETAEIDLATGLPVPEDVRLALSRIEIGAHDQAPVGRSATSHDRLTTTLVEEIEHRVADRVERLRRQSERDLAAELKRIDRYYDTVKADLRGESESGSRAIETVEREHQRRREEETRRHRVRVEVDPIQVVEHGVFVEEVSWTLTSPEGVEASVRGLRYLVGEGAWAIRCPHCGEAPGGLTVCRGGHAVGVECASTCSVCGHGFCPKHGHVACSIDGAPMCDAHAEECFSCGRVHCTDHRARCSEDHDACVDCLALCAVCQRPICTKHRVDTVADAPRGARRLCPTCVVYCEGATSEPVGVDEAATCGTCGRHICERHQVRCVVDKRPHCSTHLKRADRSRRFFCEAHAAACDDEPELLFAADEVHACVECGRRSCDRHGAACHGDDRWHCLSHLSRLTDIPDAWGCAAHRTVCHVDGRIFSQDATQACEVCGRLSCRTHRAACSWCGAVVCTQDSTDRRCVTCRRLRPSDDPPDTVVTAASAFTDGQKVRRWHVARDGGRYVVQLDLGWTRKLVLTVPHGSAAATRVVRHSLFGSAAVERRGG